MKALMCRLKKSTAIILCIILTLSAMFVYAHVEDKESKDTQFFAVQITVAKSQKQSESKLKKSLYTLVYWVNPYEAALFEDGILYQSSFTPAKAILITDNLICDRIQSYPCWKNTEYFMRI